MKYLLVRKNVKRVTIKIEGNTVRVISPHNTSKEKIDAFIISKTDWINNALHKNSGFYEKYKDLYEFNSVMLFGKFYPVVLSEGRKTQMKEGKLHIPKNKTNLPKEIFRFYVLEAEKLFQIIDNVSKENNLHFKSVTLINAKTKWGSCDKEGNIRLNWRLIMLEEYIIRYVIIHELCHFVHLNHSKSFWNEVSKFEPAYKKSRNDLKINSQLCGYLR